MGMDAVRARMADAGEITAPIDCGMVKLADLKTALEATLA